MIRWLAPLLLIAAAPAGLEQQIAADLATASPGTRFGLVVATEDGREIVALLPDQRFVPASNTKLFTTAALFDSGLDVDAPDTATGASVRLDPRPGRPPDVVLTGRGDARLSSAADCAVDCLATLADAVAARTGTVGDVIGDDSWFPDERWSPGMSWNNMPTASGTGISALTIDGNEAQVTVTPGKPPMVAGDGYYRFDNRVVNGAVTALDYERAPGGDVVRLTGTVAAARVQKLGVDDPAHFAAWHLRRLLVARGVRVAGTVQARHRPLDAGDNPVRRGSLPAARPPELAALARLSPPPLLDTATMTNKVSQNVYAELLLRRVGRVRGTGSIADGQAVVRAMLSKAGVPRTAYDFADGSGMSNYNRVSPRGTVAFLRWAAAQPWGVRWRATLPVSGEGTLRRRFLTGPLAGRIAAKTGTLNATNALAGYIRAKSGRTLVFAAYANDVPDDAGATRAVDAALERIAAAN
ncbi:D-alanyl-D-alanine carboxypeptidase/D-alanyl-D-alanine endopeptidase [Sphingomonas sp.]|jgi:D-alanyl-D-alanine carboxypeptidase/D-alanyl-D-alanine-endopeptidase (penicillin-binding protein 4)|uniref:D-alanyl-D-alanine carboxypeptidase/D-alanyl-D-alanine endopeptidase n=1 Tax=Sphingomonas sp. TaxID=28214 RepID=UPI002D8018CD|nr:D-alanyl-D-alanine carboxypeptidase/D-alanyl-D-alanine-endopeptidase [Sphingomonas sp.]HEU0045681.1 D-alanyl-D-alanine carboxypeptidase/D-alanyl-D-alanine-endopeptidase [Sphingomonas sp.]